MSWQLKALNFSLTWYGSLEAPLILSFGTLRFLSEPENNYYHENETLMTLFNYFSKAFITQFQSR